MQRNLSFRERINFQTTSTPRFHNMLMEAGAYVTMLMVVLRGSLVVSGGSANGTSLGENPGNLVQRFEVDATTKVAGFPAGKLKSLTPRSVYRRRIFDYGIPVADLSLGAGGFNGAAATYVLEQPFRLPFAIPDGNGKSVRAFDTALKLDAYNDVRLTITNGSRDTQFTGNDRTFDFSSVVYDVFDEREYPGSDQKVAVLYDEDRVINITAANSVFPVREQLPADGNYVDILWIAETTNQALADTIINEIDLYAGSEMFEKLPQNVLKALQTENTTDAATSFTGLHYTPIVRGGRLNGAVPGVWATLDVSNPGTDRLIVNTRRLKSAA